MNRHGEPDERDQERLAEYDHYLSGDPVACETCNGEGRVKVFKIDAVTQEYEPCPDCDGSGDEPTVAIPGRAGDTSLAYDAFLVWRFLERLRYTWFVPDYVLDGARRVWDVLDAKAKHEGGES